MSWTPGQRRRHAPALAEAVRANATVRPAATIEVIDLPARIGRPRLWSTPTMVQALRVVPASVQDRDTPALIAPEPAAGGLRKVRACRSLGCARPAIPFRNP